MTNLEDFITRGNFLMKGSELISLLDIIFHGVPFHRFQLLLDAFRVFPQVHPRHQRRLHKFILQVLTQCCNHHSICLHFIKIPSSERSNLRLYKQITSELTTYCCQLARLNPESTPYFTTCFHSKKWGLSLSTALRCITTSSLSRNIKYTVMKMIPFICTFTWEQTASTISIARRRIQRQLTV